MATKARRPDATPKPTAAPIATAKMAAPITGAKSQAYGLAAAKSVAYGLGKGVPPPNQIIPVPSAVKPTPWEFDLFVPWLSLLWEVPYIITVTKDLQAEYINVIRSRKPSKTKGQSVAQGAKGGKGKKKDQPSDPADFIKLGGSKNRTKLFAVNYDEQSGMDEEDSHSPSLNEIEINLTAYYDNQDNLVELTINNSEAVMPKKLVHVLLVCAPFHHSLYKLTIQKITLRTSLINYLAKFIQQSYLTDLILDDTKLTNIDFYAIFDEISPLKHVSLARCRVGDEVVAGIAARLTFNMPASKNIVLLNLTCNNVGDRGARALAHMLRANRQLCYLNLSGNMITDDGACAILSMLQEFPLTYEEFVSSRARRMEYCAQKHVIYKSCLDDILEQKVKKGSPRKIAGRKESPKSDKKADSPTKTDKKDSPIKTDKKSKGTPEAKPRKEDPKALADEMARSIMGEFVDPFDTLNMVKKDMYRFCMGNKRLCYLNMSYNNLHYPSLVKLLEVLEWQRNWPQPPVTQLPTGLSRVMLDGNNLPIECDLLETIERILVEKVMFGGDFTAIGRIDSGKGRKGVSARK